MSLRPLRCKGRNPVRAGERTRAARGRALKSRVAWLAATALLFQLFITQVHAFMGEATWALDQAAAQGLGPAAFEPTAICHFGPSGPAGPASPHATQNPACPIFQILPIVSAALASSFVVLPPPPAYTLATESVAEPSCPRAVSYGLRPQPRAPPIQA